MARATRGRLSTSARTLGFATDRRFWWHRGGKTHAHTPSAGDLGYEIGGGRSPFHVEKSSQQPQAERGHVTGASPPLAKPTTDISGGAQPNRLRPTTQWRHGPSP